MGRHGCNILPVFSGAKHFYLNYILILAYINQNVSIKQKFNRTGDKRNAERIKFGDLLH